MCPYLIFDYLDKVIIKTNKKLSEYEDDDKENVDDLEDFDLGGVDFGGVE